jgi:hypothetical protein
MFLDSLPGNGVVLRERNVLRPVPAMQTQVGLFCRSVTCGKLGHFSRLSIPSRYRSNHPPPSPSRLTLGASKWNPNSRLATSFPTTPLSLSHHKRTALISMMLTPPGYSLRIAGPRALGASADGNLSRMPPRAAVGCATRLRSGGPFGLSLTEMSFCCPSFPLAVHPFLLQPISSSATVKKVITPNSLWSASACHGLSAPYLSNPRWYFSIQFYPVVAHFARLLRWRYRGNGGSSSTMT